MAPTLGGLTPLSTGPFKGVFTSNDPYDATPDLLHAAVNSYIPDATNGSGIYQRPAFGQNDLVDGARVGEGWTHLMRDGTAYNFEISGGKIFRVSSAFSKTDVSPVGITIDSTPNTRVFMQSYNDTLIVTDGVNRPWYGTNLGATPITGTYIQMTTAAGAWTAFGRPTLFAGVLVFIVKSPAAGAASAARISIVWCEPGTQATGYEQTGYTNFANIIQTSSRQLSAIHGTNFGLYYWRDTEIGVASGIVDGSFNSTNTQAAVSTSVGCPFPATVQQYGDTIFFVDQGGHAQRLTIGGGVIGDDDSNAQMWVQMRGVVAGLAQLATHSPALLQTSVAVIHPELALYVVALYTVTLSGGYYFGPPTMYVFDARTGNYVGTWQLGAGNNIAGLCQMTDANGILRFVALASNGVEAANIYIWPMTLVAAATWSDAVVAQTVSWTTMPLGYSESLLWDAGNTAQAVVMTQSAATLALQTPNTASTSMGSVTPIASADGTYRNVWGVDIHAARGIQATITPTLGAAQVGLQRFTMLATASLATAVDA